MGDEVSALIPGLPDELALSCLAKLPLSHRHTLRAVCPSWRGHIFSEKLFWDARRSEALFYFRAPCPYGRNLWHCHHPSTKKWFRLPAMPDDDKVKGSSASAVLGENLFVVGGWLRGLKGGQQVASTAVSYFDMKSYQWKRAPSLNIARAHCISGVIESKLYVCGGVNSEGRTSTTEVYDPCSQAWTFIASMESPLNVQCGTVIDKKLHVTYHHPRTTRAPLVKGIVYDPQSDEWSDISDHFSRFLADMPVVLDGQIYAKMDSGSIDRGSGRYTIFIYTYDGEKDTWALFHHLVVGHEDTIDGIDVGQRLLVFEGKLCIVYRYLRADTLKYKIRDLEGRLITDFNVTFADFGEETPNTELLYEEEIDLVEYRIMCL